MAETAEKTKVHHGRNLKTIRETRGHKQEYVAKELGYSQPNIAKLEATEVIPDETLHQFATLYKVDLSLIKNMHIDPDKISITVQNNTFEEGSKNNVGNHDSDHDNVYNPVEEILKLTKEKEELYQQLIKKEQERADKFCKLFEDLTKQIAQINKK